MLNTKNGPAPISPTKPLIERLGGEKTINALVGALYFQILRDRRIAHFFEGANVSVLLRHQQRFLTTTFGGQATYSGRSLRSAHGHLVAESGLCDRHFDAVAENVALVMRDFGIRDEEIREVNMILESLREDVLDR